MENEIKAIAAKIAAREIGSRFIRGLQIENVLINAGFSHLFIAEHNLIEQVERLVEDNETSEKLFGISLI
jgi:hypothetical protein